MRSILVMFLVSAAVGCSDPKNSGDDQPAPQCSDGLDNDGDGAIDFPDDLGCISESDESEDSPTAAKCGDGRDNDGDGLVDFPADPGCFAPQADDETDDCPTGPNCPECADGIDNDDSGATDYPDDPGCTSASDDTEYLSNPVACGAMMRVTPLPSTGLDSGMFDSTSISALTSECGGGGGAPAVAYELHLSEARVVEVSTDEAGTTADTVIDIRSEMCASPDSSIACHDDVSASNPASKVTVSLAAGDYYIIISGHDSSSAGSYTMQVKTFAGEGAACAMPSECGPGLVCRVPLGMTAMSCSRPMCDDGVDNDGDGEDDYPTDPGCSSPEDNDETDDCPNGPNCPECGDGVDNDADGQADYPADTTCLAAGDSSESCTTTDGVTLLTMPMTMGDTSTANHDVTPPGGSPLYCASTTHSAPDRTYRLDLPTTTNLNLNLTGLTPYWDSSTSLLDSSCSGAPLKCSDSPSMNIPGLAAGAYFFVVDGYSSGAGPYVINVSGTIANGASCEDILAQSGALTCGMGYTCKGSPGARTCQPGLCGDGLDNDGDGKIDYPADPGCDSIGDDSEGDPTPLPVCANGTDDDSDSLTDWPADYGCTAASGTSEVFCAAEVDPTSLMTSTPATGTTIGMTNNFPNPGCISASGPDIAFALSLPVPVATLVLDTIGSETTFDTVLHVQTASCGMVLACNDQGGGGNKSKITMLNVDPGNYAVVVDGWNGHAGAVNLNVKGTVAPMTACSSPLFSGGANAILACPDGTTCTGTPARCQ